MEGPPRPPTSYFSIVLSPPALRPAQNSVRSSRFYEDFDAPFSLDIMNGSVSSLNTPSSSFPSSQRELSAAHVDTSHPGINPRRGALMRRGSPVRWQDVNWVSDPARGNRRSSINEKIKAWAKRSFSRVRQLSGSQDLYDSSRPRCVTPPDGIAPNETFDIYSGIVVTVTELNPSR